MVHRREIDGREIVLGNQGDLFRNAMTWWDHGTGSIWSQPTGTAILGPLEGTRLEQVPSTLTEWGAWRRAHPDTQALDAPGGRSGFDLEDLLIVVELGDAAAAWPFVALRDVGAANDELAGEPIAVVATGDRQWAVYSREVAGRTVELTLEGDELVDAATGSRWDASRGLGIAGPVAAQEDLAPLPGMTTFPEDLRSFWPDADVRLRDER